MKLRQISPSDPVTNLGLDAADQGAPILVDAEWRLKPGDLERKESVQDAQGGTTITRALNADNTAITYTPAYINVTKKIISRDVKVDKVVEQRGEDVNSVLADRTLTEMRKVFRLFQPMCFTGDSGGVVTNFDGFEQLVGTYGRTKTGGVVVPVGGDAVADQQQIAIEKLLEHAENVRFFRPDGLVHAYMNGQLKVRWLTAAKKLGYYSQIQRPDAGAVDEIIGNRIIVRTAGLAYDGSAYLLPFTEADNTSSIWFIAWDEEGEGCHLLSSAGLVGEYNGRIGNFYQNNFNLDAVLGCRDANAMVRSTGWSLG